MDNNMHNTRSYITTLASTLVLSIIYMHITLVILYSITLYGYSLVASTHESNVASHPFEKCSTRDRE